MSEPPSAFRIDVKSGLVEIAASLPVFWIVYQLGFGGESALMISLGAMYGVRLWRKGVFGPPEKWVSDRHIPILSPGHAMVCFHMFCLMGAAVVLDGGRADQLIRDGLFILFAFALAAAGTYAWRLYQAAKK